MALVNQSTQSALAWTLLFWPSTATGNLQSLRHCSLSSSDCAISTTLWRSIENVNRQAEIDNCAEAQIIKLAIIIIDDIAIGETIEAQQEAKGKQKQKEPADDNHNNNGNYKFAQFLKGDFLSDLHCFNFIDDEDGWLYTGYTRRARDFRAFTQRRTHFAVLVIYLFGPILVLLVLLRLVRKKTMLPLLAPDKLCILFPVIFCLCDKRSSMRVSFCWCKKTLVLFMVEWRNTALLPQPPRDCIKT